MTGRGLVQQPDRDRYCTTLFQRLIRPVPAVPDGVAHFVQGDALTALALELVGPLAKSHYEKHRGGSGASRRQEVA